ncbi:uncharacterized protein PFL1_00530 [Pseudozyma flocculosa PF-1]|uniref:Senescence domain-containing protein n=1 Tax=Pseudozyma flocculosa TaxID=84751 RepID=A0A5C3ET67_9BASI|nr:uncharacterized protein PFL1_00530 [Pseudozyma flocculosa PF-1]EPQ32334.1 hypothetical protein PFL1_00530 [Pseudozyma flocculosa PF-1]SPO34707.1 uncharacterized protein PSFLO_00178 [Pseudozyma flocculosa]
MWAKGGNVAHQRPLPPLLCSSWLSWLFWEALEYTRPSQRPSPSPSPPHLATELPPPPLAIHPSPSASPSTQQPPTMTSTPPTNAAGAGSQGVEILKIDNVRASQSYDGEDVTLGLGTLRALLVAIELQGSSTQDHSAAAPTDPEKLDQHRNLSTDLWLVLAIGDSFSLPIPAFQSIRPERSGNTSSYVMPSHDVEGASIRFSLPAQATKQETKRLEEILAQYSAYQDDDATDSGTIELMDDQGHVLAVVKDQFQVEEDDALSESGREKDPVLIDLAPEPAAAAAASTGKDTAHVSIAPQDREKGDWLLKGADFISRNIVKGSEFIGSKITNAADNYVAKNPGPGSSITSPTDEKGTSSGAQTPTSQRNIKVPSAAQSGAATLYNWSGQAVQVSAKTTGKITDMAANIGDKIGKKTGIQRQVKADGTLGPQPKGIRGFVNRSLLATNSVLDGVDAGVQNLLYSSSGAASQVVAHKYGEDARKLSENIARSGGNVWIVYKDVRNVRRSALLKAARGRMLKAQTPDGAQVTIRVDKDGHATVEPDNEKSAAAAPTSTSTAPAPASASAGAAPSEKTKS